MAEIRLPCGRIALIDDRDVDLVSPYHWYSFKKNRIIYVFGRLSGQRRGGVYLHRLICGDFPRVDHRNRNGLDNRRVNLRCASQRENTFNQGKRDGYLTSQYKGVFFNKEINKWRAHISAGRRRISGGHHDTEVEAALAYDALARELHGEFAALNFPHIRKSEISPQHTGWDAMWKAPYHDPLTAKETQA